MYVYLQPQGGLNDILSVIETTLIYCMKHKRKLLLDTVNTTYRINFIDYFSFLHPCIIEDINEIIKICDNDNNISIYPECSKDNMLNILNGKIKFVDNNFEMYYNNTILSLPNEKRNETIIIFSSYAKFFGFKLFKKLHLNINIKKIAKERYEKIPKPYLCIQVRNTDYKCDYIKLYNENINLIYKYKNIYVASDDENVINFFKSNNLGLNIFNFTTFNNSNNNSNENIYKNLHSNDSIDSNTKILDLMSDIYIISMSDKLLSNSKGQFITLVRNCHADKNNIIKQFN